MHTLPLVFALLWLAGLMLIQGQCVQEDAFISFRYAANLLDGHGLVYNPGERVEGYTNFLWTVMIAGAMALGADPAVAVHLAGIAAALLLCGLVLCVARMARPGGRWAGIPALALLAGTPGFAAEAVQGLETVWFALLVTLGVAMAARALETARTGPGVWSACALVLAALTRPEGGLVLALTAAGALFCSRRAGVSSRRWLAIAVGLFVLVYAPYWALRYDWYGYPFPNTFYAKTGGGVHHLLRGLGYLGQFLLYHPALTLLTAAAVPGLRAVFQRGVRPALALPLVVTIGYLGYVIVVGGDFKLTWRFVLPVLPLWALLVDSWAVGRIERHRGPVSRLAWLLVAVVVINALPSAYGTLRWSHHRAIDLERRTVCGEWLRDNAQPDAVLAIHSAGIVPFVSGLPTIDMWGLSDLHIAHRRMPDMGRARPAGHEKIDYAYVFGLAPAYILPRGWAMVTDEPFEGLADAMFPGVAAWDEHRRHYRARSVRLPPPPGETMPRYFNFVERLSSNE